jgi:hypothetical protein
MPKFLLLIHDDPKEDMVMTPEQLREAIGRYRAWSQMLAEKGHLVDAAKLADEGGRVLARSGSGVRVDDGPYAEAKEILGGYYLLEAKDYAEVVELAKGCPTLQGKGRVSLRMLDSV